MSSGRQELLTFVLSLSTGLSTFGDQRLSAQEKQEYDLLNTKPQNHSALQMDKGLIISLTRYLSSLAGVPALSKKTFYDDGNEHICSVQKRLHLLVTCGY